MKKILYPALFFALLFLSLFSNLPVQAVEGQIDLSGYIKRTITARDKLCNKAEISEAQGVPGTALKKMEEQCKKASKLVTQIQDLSSNGVSQSSTIEPILNSLEQVERSAGITPPPRNSSGGSSGGSGGSSSSSTGSSSSGSGSTSSSSSGSGSSSSNSNNSTNPGSYIQSTVTKDDNCVQTSFFGGAVCPGSENPILMLLGLILNILTYGIGIAGVLGFVISGYQYITAGDNSNQIVKAKNRMFHIVLGLVIYAVLWSLIKFLVPGEII